MTIFVAGSRQLSRLPAEVKVRLDMMVEKGFQILVGDANGADKAVQTYLALHGAALPEQRRPLAYARGGCSQGRPRPRLLLPQGPRDGRPRRVRPDAVGRQEQGTINNVVNLSRRGKLVVVYVAPTRQFRTMKTFGDLKRLLADGDSESVERIVSDLDLGDSLQRVAG